MTRRSLLDLPVTLPRHRGIVHSLFTLHWIKQTCYGIKFVTGIQKRKHECLRRKLQTSTKHEVCS